MLRCRVLQLFLSISGHEEDSSLARLATSGKFWPRYIHGIKIKLLLHPFFGSWVV